jgi:hypothetical protein
MAILAGTGSIASPVSTGSTAISQPTRSSVVCQADRIQRCSPARRSSPYTRTHPAYRAIILMVWIAVSSVLTGSVAGLHRLSLQPRKEPQRSRSLPGDGSRAHIGRCEIVHPVVSECPIPRQTRPRSALHASGTVFRNRRRAVKASVVPRSVPKPSPR